LEASEEAEVIIHGDGVAAEVEVPVEMIRHHRTMTSHLASPRILHQEPAPRLLPANKDTGLDFGPGRWVVLQPVILLGTEVETNNSRTRAGVIRKAKVSLEVTVKAEVSLETMQERGVQGGADESRQDRPDRLFRLRGTRVLALGLRAVGEFQSREGRWL